MGSFSESDLKRIEETASCAISIRSSFLTIRDSFLAQKIEVGVTAGTRIDDGGKVPGKIVGVTWCVCQRKAKGDLQRDLGRPDDFTVFPRLTVNRDLTARSNCIQERLAVASKSSNRSLTPGTNKVHFLSEMETS